LKKEIEVYEITLLSVGLCVPCPIVVRQLPDIHLPAATNTQATIEQLFNSVFFYAIRVVSYIVCSGRTGGGVETSTVTLRVVGGDEKGSLKSETVKYGLETKGHQTQEGLHWRGPVAYTKDRPVLSSERAPHKNRTVIAKQ
jgi:hypothetical protein